MTKQSEAEKAAEEYFLSTMEDIPGDIGEVPPTTLHIPIKEVPVLIRNAFLAGAAWASAPKWVSVKERMPEEYTNVLVAGREPGHLASVATYVFENEKRKWCQREKEVLVMPSDYWQPLPAAPEVEK